MTAAVTGTGPHPFRREVLGYRVEAFRLDQARDWVLEHAQLPTPRTVVTLNPELVVRARVDPDLAESIHLADLVVADGVGMLWAARRQGVALPERVPGVELATQVLRAAGPGFRVYLLGARPGVAEEAARRIQRDYGTTVVGVRDGFFDRGRDGAAVVSAIRSSGAQLLLAGLGEGQERFLEQHRAALAVPVMIGVGGTLDVLAGAVQRAPAWTRRRGLEWAWRIGSDPRRWRRAPRLLRFAALVLRSGPTLQP